MQGVTPKALDPFLHGAFARTVVERERNSLIGQPEPVQENHVLPNVWLVWNAVRARENDEGELVRHSLNVPLYNLRGGQRFCQ